MAASTLRFAIIVALVVGGVVLIDQAFPDATTADGNGGLDNGDGIEVPDPTTPPDGEDEEEEPTGEEPTFPTPGTLIVVVNAAGVDLLAGATQDALIERYDYAAAGEADTAPSTMPTTTIYFASPRDRGEAEFVSNNFFARRCDIEDVRVQRLPDGADVPADVQLAIYVGLDYAQVATPDDVC